MTTIACEVTLKSLNCEKLKLVMISITCGTSWKKGFRYYKSYNPSMGRSGRVRSLSRRHMGPICARMAHTRVSVLGHLPTVHST